MILDYFPKNLTIREGQKYILTELEKNISKYDYFVINAPTGVGKSHIAYAMSKYCESEGETSAIVTSTKMLQDQYHKEFPDIPVIKGKNNFPCEYLLDQKDIIRDPKWTINNYRQQKLSCDHGPCTQIDKNKKPRPCEYISQRKCTYYNQRDDGLDSDTVIMNYQMLFALKYVKPDDDTLLRYCMIYDEAHNIEDQIVQYNTYTYSDMFLHTLGIDIDLLYVNDDPERVLRLIEAVNNACFAKHEQAQNDVEREVWRKHTNKVEMLYTAIRLKPENFIFEERTTSSGSSLDIKPLHIFTDVTKFLNAEKQIFMSATITKAGLHTELGIPLNEIYEISIDNHPFPKEHRQMKFLNKGKITQKEIQKNPSITATTILAIQDIMRAHPNERGLVLITRKKDLDRMYDLFSNDTANRLIEGHVQNKDTSTMNEAMDALAQSENGVLVTASAWEGIDLADDLARWFIIYKMPWGDLGDKRIKQISKVNRQWYTQKCITRLTQGMGRCVRSDKDYAVGYCIDSSIQQTLVYTKHLIPKAYHDVLLNK